MSLNPVLMLVCSSPAFEMIAPQKAECNLTFCILPPLSHSLSAFPVKPAANIEQVNNPSRQSVELAPIGVGVKETNIMLYMKKTDEDLFLDPYELLLLLQIKGC